MEQPSKNRPSIEFRGIRRGGYDKYADGRLMRLTAAFPQLGLGIRVFKANATMMHGRKAAKGSSGVEIGVHQFASSSPRRNFRNTRPFSSLSSSDQESRNRTSVHFHAPVSLLALPLLASYNRKLTKVSSHVREVGSKHRAPVRSRIEQILDQNMIEGVEGTL